MMNYLLSLTFLLITTIMFGQFSPKSDFSIYLNEKELAESDYVNLDDFKNLKVRSKSNQDLENYQLQFVVVPIKMNVVVFTCAINQLSTMNIANQIAIGNVSPEVISYIGINVQEKSKSASLYSLNLVTKKLETGEEYFNEFKLYAGSGNSEMSIWLINKAIELEPANLEYLNARAILYFEIGDFSSAKNYFLEILEQEPNYVSYSFLSTTLFKMNDFEGSIKYSLLSIENIANDLMKSNHYTQIGDANISMFHYQEAYNSYLKALELNPKNVNALNNISVVCDDVGKPEEKIGYLNRVVEADPSFYQVHVNIGFEYIANGEYEKAIAEFDAVLKVDSIQPNALCNKAFCYYKLNKLKLAKEYIEKAIKASPTNSYAYKNRALIKIAAKEKKSACEDLQKALELNYTAQYGNEVNELIAKYCK